MTRRIITADEARVLREAATPGPWHVGRSALCDCLRPCMNVYAEHGEDVTRPCRSDVSEGDAPLLAAAPDLAATVEALHAEVARLRALVREAYREGFAASDEMGWHSDDSASETRWLASAARAALEVTP
jgi:hypothetical protein